jgi:hypothetical protein
LTWHYLQYVLGLVRLGHDVYYIEDSGEWPYIEHPGPRGDWIARDCTENVNHLAAIMERYGLKDRWAYHWPAHRRWFGLSKSGRRAVIDSADILINVSGTLLRPADYRKVQRLVYIDTDPVFTQVKLNLARGQGKFRERVDAHDVHFTFGEELKAPVPATRHRWMPTRQPIVLSEWVPHGHPRDVFTTVMNWASYKPLRYGGRLFGQKDVEFERFLELPRKVTPTTLEVALGPTRHVDWESRGRSDQRERDVLEVGGSTAPEARLRQAGWRVVDAMDVCSHPDAYRAYIESSKAELTIAKNGYVVGRPAWFSERSACYLAAGRPVVAEDTGFSTIIPVGDGVLSFNTPDEAVSAIHEVEHNYAQHASAARAVAEACFDSDKVLGRLIETAGSR